jgi:hypothetical protein
LQVYESEKLIAVCKKLYGSDWEELRSLTIETMITRPLVNINLINLSMTIAGNIFKNNYNFNKKFEECDLTNVAYQSTHELKELQEICSQKLVKKIESDKSNIKRMYEANVFDIYIKSNCNILKAQRKIKLPYFEIYSRVQDYKTYLIDYFKNK